jgi:hypothetical protein
MKKIARLRAAPDGDLFKDIYDALSARAKALVPEQKRRVQSALDAALRANSVDGLDAAARELFRLEGA